MAAAPTILKSWVWFNFQKKNASAAGKIFLFIGA
jgi:hypothetical protein